MTAQEAYLKITEKLQQALEKNSRVRNILKRVLSGKCTNKDSSAYASIYSRTMGKILASFLPELTEIGAREEVCTKLLKDSYKDINALASDVQKSIDEKAGINLAPRQGDFPAERVEKIAHSLEDKTVPIKTNQRRAENSVANVSMSFYDDFVQENASYRDRAGMKCYITRTAAGNCCNWCASLEGRYEYGTEPEEIYHRHDKCHCTVVFESGRQQQDVWTKKPPQKKDFSPEEKDSAAPTILTPEQSRTLEEKSAQKLGLTNIQSGDILKQNPLNISLQYFANKNIPLQTDSELKKSISSWKKRIEEHQEKIAHPEKLYDDWNTFEERVKNGLFRHWKHEIDTLNKDINLAEEELKNRGVKK